VTSRDEPEPTSAGERFVRLTPPQSFPHTRSGPNPTQQRLCEVMFLNLHLLGTHRYQVESSMPPIRGCGWELGRWLQLTGRAGDALACLRRARSDAKEMRWPPRSDAVLHNRTVLGSATKMRKTRMPFR
jgi:hypothetical protein